MWFHEEHRKEPVFAATDASGRQISLLNDGCLDVSMTNRMGGLPPVPGELPFTANDGLSSPQDSSSSLSDDNQTSHPQHAADSGKASATGTASNGQSPPSRRYTCTEPGCNKSFTTSGHLARHHRIHTGERNFRCLFPGCQSRFSRQDNMMQHYRTHMAPKSRRSQRRLTSTVNAQRPLPLLHAHHRIQSDPLGTEPPLTIDQHLHNYHRQTFVAGTSDKHAIQASSLDVNQPSKTATAAAFSTSSSPPPVDPSPPSSRQPTVISPEASSESYPEFFKHQSLNLLPAGQAPLPFSLLHPDVCDHNEQDTEDICGQDAKHLLHLAHIVSTFG